MLNSNTKSTTFVI